MLYAATLRMITDTHAEAEWWVNQWKEEFFSDVKIADLNPDGTIQIQVEELPDNDSHISVMDIVSGNPDALRTYKETRLVREALDLAYKQGYLKAVKDAVTWKNSERNR
jgi:hypothetical protein